MKLTEHPRWEEKLKDEWDYEKNKSPEHFTHGMDKKVWWKCKKHKHEWKARIYSRTSKKSSNCPYCTGKKILIGFNDLLTTYPKLCEEWNYEKNESPELYVYGSNKKVWWKCKKHGHEWESVIANRARLGRGCPYCAGKKILIGFNDLLTTYPKLCEEWNYEKNERGPECFVSGSKTRVWWKCKNGHEWETILQSRTLKGSNCPYCCGQKCIKNINDLLTINPELCKEWNYEKNKNGPETYTQCSGQLVWWKCLNHSHEWKCTINNRVINKRGCPYCSCRKLLSGFNDLLTTNPELCKEWDYKKNKFGPETYSRCAPKKVWWICKNGHSYFSAISNRSGSETGCPQCVYKSQRITGEILKDHFPKIKIKTESILKKPVLNEQGKEIKKSTRIDFKLMLNNLLIFVEYNGYQHYEKAHFHKSEKDFIIQQQRDQWLRNYCKDNNIILIEIDGRKYKTREEIEPYLLKEIFSKVVNQKKSKFNLISPKLFKKVC